MTVLDGSQVSTISDTCQRLNQFVTNEVFKYAAPSKETLPMSVTTTTSLVNPLPTETTVGNDTWAYQYCDYPAKIQLQTQCTYYIGSFNDVLAKLGADSTHDIPDTLLSKWLSLFNGFSQWVTNVKTKYVGDYIDAIVVKPSPSLDVIGDIKIPPIGSQGVGSACRVTNFGSYTVVTPVHFKIPDDFKTKCDTAKNNCNDAISALNQPPPNVPDKVLKPVPSIETGTTDLIDAVSRIYQLCNDQFAYLNTKSTLISDNTEDAINMLNTITGNIDTVLNTITKFHESENNSLAETNSIVKSIREEAASYHESENDSLYIIKTNLEQASADILTLFTNIQTISNYIAESNQTIFQNLQTIADSIPDKNGITQALQQLENANSTRYNDIVNRLNEIVSRIN